MAVRVVAVVEPGNGSGDASGEPAEQAPEPAVGPEAPDGPGALVEAPDGPGALVEARPRRRLSRGWTSVIGIGVVLYLVVLVLYAGSGRNVGYEPSAPRPADGVEVAIQLSDLDARTGRMHADLTLIPGEDLLSADELTPSQDLGVVVVPVAGSQQLRFPRGQVPATVPIEVMLEGEIENWPFDRYGGLMVLQAFRTTGDLHEPVPLVVSIEGSVKGWKTSAAPTLDDAATVQAGQQVIELSAARAGGTLAFGLIMVLVLVTLPVLALFVCYQVLRGRRRAEPAYAGWIAAMLFATVPLSGFLPDPVPGST